MKKIFLPALCLVLVLTISLVAVGVGGDQSDPAVTLSYLEKIWGPELKTQAESAVSATLLPVYNNALRDLAKKVAQQNLSQYQNNRNARNTLGRLVLKQGDTIFPVAGCKLTLFSGAVTCDATLVNVTNGTPGGTAMATRIQYMQSDLASPGLVVTTPTAELLVNGAYRLTPSDAPDFGSLADGLSRMGLFRGMSGGYELQGSTTRAQGLVMFLRLLGKENDALKSTAKIPFTDVPATHWAYPYVAYAYENGLTTGVTATAFSPDAGVTAQHYLTFLMRALHYTEGSDFSYNTVLSDVVENGLFQTEEIASMGAGSFLRHKMVYLSYYALFCEDAQSHELLLETLISTGVMKEADAHGGLAAVRGWRLG